MAENTINAGQFPTEGFLLTDFIVKTLEDGTLQKDTVQNLLTLLETVGEVGFKGKLLIADIPTSDGWYFAGESGTYTNSGGLVIDISGNLAIIIVSDAQTTFEKVDIPLNIISTDNVVKDSNELIESGGVYKSFLRDKPYIYTTDDNLDGITIEKVSNEVVITLTGDWFILKGETSSSAKYCRITQTSKVFKIPSTKRLVLDKNAITSLSTSDIIPDTAYNIVSDTAQGDILTDLNFDKILLYEWYLDDKNTRGLFRNIEISKKIEQIVKLDTILKKRQETQFYIFNQSKTSGDIELNYDSNGDAILTLTGDLLLHTGYSSNLNFPYTRILKTGTKTIKVPKTFSLYLDISQSLVNDSGTDLPDTAFTMTSDVANVSALATYPTDKVLLFSNWSQDFKSAQGLIKDYIVRDFIVNSTNKNINIPLQPLNQTIYDKLPIFTEKYAYGLNENAQTPLNIVLLGDSLFAREIYTSQLDVVPSENPPTLITKNIGAYLKDYIQGQIPLYSRYDKSGVFTEIGTWETVTTNPNWDDSGDRPINTRRTNTENASLEFTTDKPYFNFVDRIDVNSSDNLIVSVASGNGRVWARLEGSVSWVEANGFVFSQNKSDYGGVDNANGYGNTIYGRRVQFRKVSGGIGSNDTITITKPNDTTSFLYWGLEEIEVDKPYTNIINSARGGHRLDMLENYIEDDLYNRNPNLVILEIPFLNMIPFNSNLSYNLNSLQDFVWGDRVGFENVNSLKNRSNNWGDFNVLLVIPHYSQNQINTDNDFINQSSGYSAEEIYKSIKGFILSKGDLPFIDISTNMINSINVDTAFTGIYNALEGSGVNGNTYLSDGIHQNDKGTRVWVSSLAPLLQLN